MAIHSIIRLGDALLLALAIALGSTAGAAHAEPVPPPPEPVILVPAIYPGDPYGGTFTRTAVKVHTAPRTSARLIAIGQIGDLIGVRCVKDVSAFDGAPPSRWYRISGPRNTYQGWADTRYVLPVVPVIACGPGVS